MTGFSLDLKRMRKEIKALGLDGWLFYDFRGLDPITLKILGFTSDMIGSRRWFYLVPALGEPRKLVSRVEIHKLDHLQGETRGYLSWRELEESLRGLLSGIKRVAMQYSPQNSIPYVSKLDAGMMELMRPLGVEIVSSADLVQSFEAIMNETEMRSHIAAGKSLRAIVDAAFGEIARAKKNGTDEYRIQQFILSEMEKEGMQIEDVPCVAVNEHCSDPHYEPTDKKHAKIVKGNLVLIDLFARKKGKDSIFADYTFMGYVGSSVPRKYGDVFEIVRDARDLAFKFVHNALKAGKEVRGFEVDDVARNHISKMGYGQYFIHRTGHSIGRTCHGNGANMDNLETHDERKIVPGLCFSIEPGIYLKEFGIRSEIDVYIDGKEAKISGLPIQTEIANIV